MLFITGLHFESPTFSSRSLTQAHLHRRIIDVLWRGARANIILQKSEFSLAKVSYSTCGRLPLIFVFVIGGVSEKAIPPLGKPSTYKSLNVQIYLLINLASLFNLPRAQVYGPMALVYMLI